MANVQKNKMAATGHLFKHYERGQDETGEYTKFGNQDIDPERTHLNYNLAPDQERSQLEILKNRLSEIKCHKRADVNVMCSWVITMPKDFPLEHEGAFFRQSYDFLSKRYGEENVISAYVHKDETTPHMHFAFVPVVHDKKKDIDKVSSKELLTKSELQRFHPELQKSLESYLQFPIHVINGATQEGNKSINELKRKAAVERLQEANQEAKGIIESGKKIVADNIGKSQERLKETEQKCAQMISKARQEAQGIKDRLVPLKAEYEARRAFIDQSVKDSDASMMYPDYAKPSKSLLGKEMVTVPKDKWEARHVSANQLDALRKEREILEKGIASIRKSAPAQKIKALENEVNELRTENRDITLKLDKAYKDIERVNKVFEKKPEIKKAFQEAEKVLKLKAKGSETEH